MTDQTSPEQSAAPAACEWQMVPKEPTEEMLDQAAYGYRQIPRVALRHIWVQMFLAAAPSPAPTDDALRQRFEEWMASSNYPEIADIALSKLPDGTYKSQLTFAAWQAWKAPLRLALAPAPVPPSPLAEENAKLRAALVSVREELWVDFCLHRNNTHIDPAREFDMKPHIRTINNVVSRDEGDCYNRSRRALAASKGETQERATSPRQ